MTVRGKAVTPANEEIPVKRKKNVLIIANV